VYLFPIVDALDSRLGNAANVAAGKHSGFARSCIIDVHKKN
jgi:hypothetical protein